MLFDSLSCICMLTEAQMLMLLAAVPSRQAQEKEEIRVLLALASEASEASEEWGNNQRPFNYTVHSTLLALCAAIHHVYYGCLLAQSKALLNRAITAYDLRCPWL